MNALTLNLDSIIQLTQEKFVQLCQNNPELTLELSSHGELLIISPTGGETGRKNSNINFQLSLWNEKIQLGEVFDSSTGFILPNGANRSPDAAWIEKSRWEMLTIEQREQFVPLCPDFVIELLSPSDNLKQTQDKMQEYLENGCRLGWLINRGKKEVEIYHPGQELEVLKSPKALSGETVLLEFSLNLQEIWE